LVSLIYYLEMPANDSSSTRLKPQTQPEALIDDRWRETHLGRLLGHAMRRFDARVLNLMANNDQVPLALSNLAARDQISAAHIHITRHLSLKGSRLTDLAQSAGMSKQAMGHLVSQCEAWGLVERQSDARDARAKQVVFTAAGLAWLAAFQTAVDQAELEFKESVGMEIATVVALGLEAYCV
jgi:DNA-binding MarR family transcriptional regulator